MKNKVHMTKASSFGGVTVFSRGDSRASSGRLSKTGETGWLGFLCFSLPHLPHPPTLLWGAGSHVVDPPSSGHTSSGAVDTRWQQEHFKLLTHLLSQDLEFLENFVLDIVQSESVINLTFAKKCSCCCQSFSWHS